MATDRLEPQAALEVAALTLIRALGYTDAQADRTCFGEPHPRAGLTFVSVWSDLSRSSKYKNALWEIMAFQVMITRRIVNPKDRWIDHKDDLEKRGNAIRARLCVDGLGYDVMNKANELGGYNPAGGGPTAVAGNPVGFCEALKFLGFDALQRRGGDWFAADPSEPAAGLSLNIRFGEISRIQGQTDLQGRA